MQPIATAQIEDQIRFREFAAAKIGSGAAAFDAEQRIPRALIEEMASAGLLCLTVRRRFGGHGQDAWTYGLLNEEIGACCSSVRCLLTVHDMVAASIERWGTAFQREYWLPRMVSGETIAAFALTEPAVGSDAASVETTAVRSKHGFELTGVKRWITSSGIADVFLTFAKLDGRNCAFLVDRSAPGLSIVSTPNMLGVRGSMVGELRLDDCLVEGERLLGQPGFGFTCVASGALDFGRYAVAWGCVGLTRACVEACFMYTSARHQFGPPIFDQQLIRRMLTEMVVNLDAARLLCRQAGELRDAADPHALQETSIAKYFASRAASMAANDAVQMHGGNGCGPCYPVERYFRDARIMQIIEGSNEMHQINISGDLAFS
jgi:glutaryl-CoA dehydrogenase (non-decarboxylating)